MNRLLDKLDFSEVRTLYTKENSDEEEWRRCCEIPLELLHRDERYRIISLRGKNERWYGHSFMGNVNNIWAKVLSKVEQYEQILYVITDERDEKIFWLISRV